MTISNFEQKLLEHFVSKDFDTLLDAAVDYCEIHDVDYSEISKTVKFSSTFLEKIAIEARKNNLLKDSKSKHEPLDLT